tara:strand:+ start:55 stop:1074 length:1020 start_codon:yes stop_codon:yes gene_type:complete
MPVKLGGGGGGGNTPFPTIVFQTSRTWTCPMAMEAMVFVIGAGGGGAAGCAQGSNKVITNGGGGGGCSVSKLTLAAQDYTVVVGSRGSGGSRSEAQGNGVDDGSAGGNSTFAGSGITTMAGNGGGGGSGQRADNPVSGVVAGGTATGGTIANNTGGGCPNRSLSNHYSNAGSGGGVGIWEVGEANLMAVSTNQLVQGGGPFRNRGLGVTSIPGGEGGTSVGMLTGDIFKGIQQMVRDQSSNGYASHPTRYNNSVNYTGRPVKIMPPLNVTNYRWPSGSSPFTGGAGLVIAGSGYSGQGSAGVAGGGGGSCSFSNGTFGTAYGGTGGNGVIIIMPLTVGT